jgi:hypothetical protein
MWFNKNGLIVVRNGNHNGIDRTPDQMYQIIKSLTETKDK